jgi:hypothetical protein
MRLNRCLAALAGLSLAGSACATDPVEMYELPVFMGPSDSHVNVERIHLTNHSDVAQRAVVTVDGAAEYPATIPPLRSADVTIFKTAPSFDQARGCVIALSAEPVEGKGSRSSSSITALQIPAASYQRCLVISSQGADESLFYTPGKSRIATEIYTCRPRSAPDRPCAYSAFSTVYVDSASSGALSSGAVTALEDYALLGGRLVFPAGLTDRRWLGIVDKPTGFTPIGIGSMLKLGYQPIGRREQFLKDYWSFVGMAGLGWLDASQPASLDSPSQSPPGSPNAVRVDGANPVRQDPFSVTLPPFFEVLGLLFLYFVAVIPLNFLVLSRLKKPELTWITAPAFAAIFAGVMFHGATNLYGARTSSATQGVLVAQEGLNEGLFKGTSEVFIQHSGTVDLGLRGIDQLAFSGQVASAVPGSIDDGTVRVPKFEAQNLQFKTVTFTQRVPTQGWFEFKWEKPHDGFYPIRVTNKSPYRINRARLIVGALKGPLGTIEPGGSMDMETVPMPATMVDIKAMGIPDLAHAEGRILLTGEIEGLQAGCNVGRNVADRSSLGLAAFSRPEMMAMIYEHH